MASSKERFSPQLFRQIAWGSIEDSRQFCTTGLHTDIFATGKPVPLTLYPTSQLDDVIQYVGYGQAVFQDTFPQLWRSGGISTGGALGNLVNGCCGGIGVAGSNKRWGVSLTHP